MEANGGHWIDHRDLREQVRAQVRRARRSGALVTLDTRLELVPDAGVTFLVRVAAPGAFDRPAGATGRLDGADPFAPPLEPDLYVGELSATHRAVLNKFHVLDDHLLLITREWADQTEMLDTADFEALLLGLAGVDGLAFYNGGPEAGASQAHKHLQLVPLPLASRGPALPFAVRLEELTRGGGIGRVPGVPFRHAAAPMRPEWIEDPVRHAGAAAESAAALWRRLGHEPGVRRQPIPYNLLATRRFLWLVPRSRAGWSGLPVNALGFAGALLATDEEAFEHLCETGPMRLLTAVADPVTEGG
jgi:ATP adenylyltransferase